MTSVRQARNGADVELREVTNRAQHRMSWTPAKLRTSERTSTASGVDVSMQGITTSDWGKGQSGGPLLDAIIPEEKYGNMDIYHAFR